MPKAMRPVRRQPGWLSSILAGGAFEARRANARKGCPRPMNHDFLSAGTGTPAILTLNEPRLVRVQK
jgi:hypothetical protein